MNTASKVPEYTGAVSFGMCIFLSEAKIYLGTHSYV